MCKHFKLKRMVLGLLMAGAQMTSFATFSNLNAADTKAAPYSVETAECRYELFIRYDIPPYDPTTMAALIAQATAKVEADYTVPTFTELKRCLKAAQTTPTAETQDALSNALSNLKENTMPYNIVMNIYQDPARKMAFNWFTNANITGGKVQIVQGVATSQNAFTAPLKTVNATCTQLSNMNYNVTANDVTTLANITANTKKSYTENKAVVTGLTPGTTYSFRVGKEGAWSEIGTFTTAQSIKAPFSFVYTTDPQANTYDMFDISQRTTHTAKNRYPNANFWLHCGDLVETSGNTNSEWEWERLFETQQDIFLNKPFAPIQGNHDVSANNLNFRRHFNTEIIKFDSIMATYPGSVYSYVYGDALFLALNFENYNTANYLDSLSSWMIREVAKNPDTKWRIVYYHKAVYTGSSSHHRDSDAKTVREKMAPLFDSLKIDVALQGHDHIYEVIGPVKSQQLIAGAISNQITVTPHDSTNVTGKLQGIYDTQNGTLYFLNNSAGKKKYYPYSLSQIAGYVSTTGVPSYATLFTGRFGQTGRPTYSNIDVTTDTITFTTYEVFDDGTDLLFDKFQVVKTLSQVSENWIDEDFSTFAAEGAYIQSVNTVNTHPNNIQLERFYANFETIETTAACNDGKTSGNLLRIRGKSDNGYASFKVPDAEHVRIALKAKSTSQNRVAEVLFNGEVVARYTGLDANHCSVLDTNVHTSDTLIVVIRGGLADDTNPICVNSIQVSKYTNAVIHNLLDSLTNIANAKIEADYTIPSFTEMKKCWVAAQNSPNSATLIQNFENAINNLKANTMPYNIVMNIYQDPTTKMAFNWFTNANVTGGKVQIVQGNATNESAFSTPLMTLNARSLAINNIVYTHSRNEMDAIANIPTGATRSYTENKAVATGLTPNTTYSFRVGKEGAWSSIGTFTTAKTTTDLFSFVYTTDPQANTYEMFDISQRTTHAAQNRYPNANFWLHCGDLVESSGNPNSEWEWEQLFETQQDIFLNKPFAPIQGNHDVSTNRNFAHHFNTDTVTFDRTMATSPGSVYSYVYGDALFLAINFEDWSNAAYMDSLASWLYSEVAKNPDTKWRIAYYHKAVYTGSQSHQSDNDAKSVRDRMAPVFDSLRIDVALQGHDHIYEVIGPVKSKELIAGAATNQTIVTPQARENVTGKLNGIYDTKEGTLYFLNNSAGKKKYEPRSQAQMDAAESTLGIVNYFGLFTGRFGQTGRPTFSNIVVTTDTIAITTYEVWENDSIGLFDEFKIVKTAACDTVSHITVSNIQLTSADITWTAVQGQTSWIVEYGVPGSTTIDAFTVQNTPATTLTNLTPNTKYGLRISASCSENSISEWSATTTFTTRTTGINSTGMESNISLYPNPTDGIVTLKVNNIHEKCTVSITSLIGVSLSQYTFDGTTSNSLNLDLRQFAKGVYFVQLRTEQGKLYTDKLILK